MYQEWIAPLPHSPIESVWYADSLNEEGYAVSPELTANLVIKFFANHSEVLLSGAVTHQKTYPYIPDAQYFGVRLQPGYNIFDKRVSLYQLQDTSISVSQHSLSQWDCLAERLYDIKSVHQQLVQFIRGVASMLNESSVLPPTIQEAMFHIHCKQGVLTVGELSQMTMMSERHLERLFKTHIGLSPRLVCQTVRIRRIVDILWQSPEKPDLSNLALQFGYVDQSHLANDFRNRIGMSISDYMRYHQ